MRQSNSDIGDSNNNNNKSSAAAGRRNFHHRPSGVRAPASVRVARNLFGLFAAQAACGWSERESDHRTHTEGANVRARARERDREGERKLLHVGALDGR